MTPFSFNHRIVKGDLMLGPTIKNKGTEPQKSGQAVADIKPLCHYTAEFGVPPGRCFHAGRGYHRPLGAAVIGCLQHKGCM